MNDRLADLCGDALMDPGFAPAAATSPLARTLFAQAREGILVTDASGRILDVNPAFTEITGYTRAQVLGRNPAMLSSGRHDRAFYRAMWETLHAEGCWSGEIWNRRADGELFAELLRLAAVRDDHGQVTHYVALFTDITRHKRQEEALQRLAHHDPLTGLPNRVLLTDRLQTLISQCAREHRALAVGVLDLDGFQAVNDALGHAAGDALLLQAAERLRQTLRAGDTVARLGGDEFALLLGQGRSRAEAAAAAARVLEALAQPYALGEGTAQVGASLGVALYPQHGTTPDQLLRNAGQAMLQAKQQGRHRACFVGDADGEAAACCPHAQAVRQALHQGQLRLHYQPQVEAGSGQVRGAEALLRWQHPVRGLLPPAEFLLQVQGTALECEIDAWVLEQGVAQLGRWVRQGLTLDLSLNLSAATLLQPQLPERVAALVQLHGVPPGRLELEVLETAALADMAVVVQAMQACAGAGVRFALDDFGTGYSSLHYLRQLPVSMLKIDQGFVRRMLDDAGDMHIVRAMLGLAGTFGVSTVAEGVETAAHAQALTDLGCTLLQGHWIARPMPAEALEHWLVQRTVQKG